MHLRPATRHAQPGFLVLVMAEEQVACLVQLQQGLLVNLRRR
jgi:hypothetical protein